MFATENPARINFVSSSPIELDTLARPCNKTTQSSAKAGFAKFKAKTKIRKLKDTDLRITTPADIKTFKIRLTASLTQPHIVFSRLIVLN